MNTAMKSIVYRGGLVEFQIPEDWKEEYEAHGGGTFFEDRPDTGTLRLNVISFQKHDGLAVEDAARIVFSGEKYEIMASGFPIRRYMIKAEEQGTPLHLYRWDILVPVPPNSWRLTCFTHTIVAAQDGGERSREELQLVERIAREAIYSTSPGETRKPWWRFWG